MIDPGPELVAKLSGVRDPEDAATDVLVGDQVTVCAWAENVKTTSVNPELAFAVAAAIARIVQVPTDTAETTPVELFTAH